MGDYEDITAARDAELRAARLKRHLAECHPCRGCLEVLNDYRRVLHLIESLLGCFRRGPLQVRAPLPRTEKEAWHDA